MQTNRWWPVVAAVFVFGTLALVVAIYRRGRGIVMDDPQQLFVLALVAVALIGLATLVSEFLPLFSE